MSETYGHFIQEIRSRISTKSKEELIVELDLLSKVHMEVLDELKKRHQLASKDFVGKFIK